MFNFVYCARGAHSAILKVIYSPIRAISQCGKIPKLGSIYKLQVKKGE